MIIYTGTINWETVTEQIITPVHNPLFLTPTVTRTDVGYFEGVIQTDRGILNSSVGKRIYYTPERNYYIIQVLTVYTFIIQSFNRKGEPADDVFHNEVFELHV